MTGAEKLPERLASAFEEQFGIRPFEGLRLHRVLARGGAEHA